jgi:hypothetical protein
VAATVAGRKLACALFSRFNSAPLRSGEQIWGDDLMARFARLRFAVACVLPLLAAHAVQAQNAKYDPGADDKTIKIGTTAPGSYFAFWA